MHAVVDAPGFAANAMHVLPNCIYKSFTWLLSLHRWLCVQVPGTVTQQQQQHSAGGNQETSPVHAAFSVNGCARVATAHHCLRAVSCSDPVRSGSFHQPCSECPENTGQGSDHHPAWLLLAMPPSSVRRLQLDWDVSLQRLTQLGGSEAAAV